MNDVQRSYAPPRWIALSLGVLIFVIYHLIRRPALLTDATPGEPLPLVIAVVMSVILGYGMTMSGWLIVRTKRQIWATFRPSSGRLIGAFCFALVAPVLVLSWMPWTVAGFTPFIIGNDPLMGISIILKATLYAYPLSAMIVRHTYHRHWLRFGLFCLSFWTIYAGHLLYSGGMVFRL